MVVVVVAGNDVMGKWEEEEETQSKQQKCALSHGRNVVPLADP